MSDLLNTALIVLALAAMETVLSADHAVALAVLVQPLSHPKQQQPDWILLVTIAVLFVWGSSKRSETHLRTQSAVLVDSSSLTRFG